MCRIRQSTNIVYNTVSFTHHIIINLLNYIHHYLPSTLYHQLLVILSLMTNNLHYRLSLFLFGSGAPEITMQGELVSNQHYLSNKAISWKASLRKSILVAVLAVNNWAFPVTCKGQNNSHNKSLDQQLVRLITGNEIFTTYSYKLYPYNIFVEICTSSYQRYGKAALTSNSKLLAPLLWTLPVQEHR